MINKIYLSAIVGATILFSSCDNSKKDNNDSNVPVATVAKEAATEGKSVTITTEEVPDTVRMLFSKKYPGATKVVWMKYEPVESDELKMDDQYYYVTYAADGADYTSWYNNHGQWVKTSTKVTGNAMLPDPVNKTINDQYPGYMIVEIDKENDKDMDMYEVKLRKGEEKAKLKILPDGTIFKRK
jgi:hypothetical protein